MLFATMEPGKIRLCNRQTRRFYKLYPYLTNLANDISLGQLTYYNKISERSAFAGSLRYFGFEKLNYVKLEANEQFRTVSPNEFAIDGSYSLKLKKHSPWR
jgi:hypothetical protein